MEVKEDISNIQMLLGAVGSTKIMYVAGKQRLSFLIPKLEGVLKIQKISSHLIREVELSGNKCPKIEMTKAMWWIWSCHFFPRLMFLSMSLRHNHKELGFQFRKKLLTSIIKPANSTERYGVNYKVKDAQIRIVCIISLQLSEFFLNLFIHGDLNHRVCQHCRRILLQIFIICVAEGHRSQR